jgi:hypothetical protein
MLRPGVSEAVQSQARLAALDTNRNGFLNHPLETIS